MKKKGEFPKWAIALIIINIVILTMVFPFCCFLYAMDWKESHAIRYINDLHGYELSKISGTSLKIETDEYANFNKHISDSINNRTTSIFPSTVDVTDDCKLYLFYHLETVKKYRDWYDRIEIYLSCEWPSGEFEKEKERLLSLSGGNKKRCLESQDLFGLVSLVFSYNNGFFTYVSFDDEKQTMHYIYIREIDLDSMIFQENIKPKKILQDSDLKNNKYCHKGSYSIWY